LVHHLGINRASLYDTFGDKEQLFKKSFELYRQSNKEDLIQFFKNEPNIKEGFAKLFNKAIEVAILDDEKKGCFVVNTTTELIPNNESLLAVLKLNKEEVENIFYQYLKSNAQTN